MNCEKVNFELKTTTWGITKDKKFDGISVPIVIRDQDTINYTIDLSDKYNAKSPLYGNNPDYKTLYLNLPIYKLSDKLRHDLYDKGRQQISISFELYGVAETKYTNYLKFKITKLQKIEKQQKQED